jgi:hypothetical protein
MTDKIVTVSIYLLSAHRLRLVHDPCQLTSYTTCIKHPISTLEIIYTFPLLQRHLPKFDNPSSKASKLPLPIRTLMHPRTEAYPLSPKANRRPPHRRFPDQVTTTQARLSLKIIILLIHAFVINKNTHFFCMVKIYSQKQAIKQSTSRTKNDFIVNNIISKIHFLKCRSTSLLAPFRDTGLVGFTMSDSIDTITEVESIEQDSQIKEPFRRFIRHAEVQHDNGDRRIMSEQDAQVQKRLTSSSERMLSACAGALLTSFLGKDKRYTSICSISNTC